MSWICPWCGVENDIAMPEGRHVEKCYHCEKDVPSREAFKKYKEKLIDALEKEKFQLELQVDRLDYKIDGIKEASFDRPKVRVIAKDQAKLPLSNGVLV
ncbi:MAG: hypothetical protein M0Q91_05365 [Methanoregula sp.]|jgi:hypothetical protein|nr:hypothetical protein [Methanoregula sp.]